MVSLVGGDILFSVIFEKTEVVQLLSKISTNPRYYDKKKKDSINYEKFSGLEQPIFLAIDSLLKYQILIGDEEYLIDYLHHLDLLWYKIDNFHDISEGISKILVKFCARKLGFKNKIEEHRREILEYIYQKYVVDGYFFHAVSDVYVSKIKEVGFIPQQYENYYSQFLDIQKKYPSFFADMDFTHDYISFTDDFVMACYYAVYSPIYFSSFLGSTVSKSKKIVLNSYARRDYISCFHTLHSFLKNRELGEDEVKEIEDLCKNQWKLLRQNEACPTIMMVKRSFFSRNTFQGIEEIFQDKKEDIGVLASHIMDSRFHSFNWNKVIPSSDIMFAVIPYSKFVVEPFLKEDKIDVILLEKGDDNKEDGKVSLLFLFGSIFILLGVLLTIIMLYQ